MDMLLQWLEVATPEQVAWHDGILEVVAIACQLNSFGNLKPINGQQHVQLCPAIRGTFPCFQWKVVYQISALCGDKCLDKPTGII